MTKRLIGITTCGDKNFIYGVLSSLREENSDIIIIDDGSDLDYSNIIKDYKFKLIKKDIGKGLTDSWNTIYKIFKDNNYDMCVLTNDDVIFPNKVPDDMWLGLNKYTFIGPLSDPIGSGRFMGNFQNIDYYLRNNKNYMDSIGINKKLQKIHPNKRFLEIGKDIKLPRAEPPYINGFCFSFNRNIINYEYSKDILFNPDKINVGNEKELQQYRLDKNKAISIKSYVFHYKGQTIDKSNRNNIINK